MPGIVEVRSTRLMRMSPGPTLSATSLMLPTRVFVPIGFPAVMFATVRMIPVVFVAVLVSVTRLHSISLVRWILRLVTVGIRASIVSFSACLRPMVGRYHVSPPRWFSFVFIKFARKTIHPFAMSAHELAARDRSVAIGVDVIKDRVRVRRRCTVRSAAGRTASRRSIWRLGDDRR